MDKIFQGILLSGTLLLCAETIAQEDSPQSEKHWSVGVGSYAFVVSNDNDNIDSADFGGYSFSGAYAFNNHFQVRATYFSLENEDFNDFDSSGFDLMGYGGMGLSEKGFRAYGGAGMFSDTWDYAGQDDSFSGFQLGGGIGYNWGQVALDFVINLREAEEYEDFLLAPGTYVTLSGNLAISYLF